MMTLSSCRPQGLSRVLVVLSILCSGSTALGAESVLLTPKIRPGEVAYLEIAEVLNSHIRGGMFGEEGHKSKATRTFTVRRQTKLAPEEAGTIITFTFDRIQTETESMRGTISFDSDVDDPKETPGPVAAVYGPVLGESLTLRLDDDGRVVSFTGMEDIYLKVEETAVGSPILTQHLDEFTDAGARLMWVDARRALYPFKKVAVGETWRTSVENPHVYLGKTIREYNCKLEKIAEKNGRRIAEVTYTADYVKPEDYRPGSRMFYMLLNFKSGRIEGRAEYDIDRGEYVTQQEQGHLVIDAEMDAPEPGETVTINFDAVVDRTITVMSQAEREAQKAENIKAAEAARAQQTPAAGSGAEARAKEEQEVKQDD